MNKSSTFEFSDISLYVLFASATTVYYLLPLWAGAFSDHYLFPEEKIGFLLSADMATNTLAAFVSRYWIRKLPWRPILVLAIATATAANLSCLFNESYTVILGARLVCGFSAGSMVAIVYNAFSSRQNPVRHFSLAMGLQIIFGMVCLSLFPYLPVAADPGTIFLIVTLLNLLPLAFFRWLPKADQHPVPGDKTPIPNTPKAESKNLLFLLAVLLFFSAMTIVWVYMERLGVNLEFSEHNIANILSLSLLFSLAGSLTPIWSSKYFAKRASLYCALAGLLTVIIVIPEIEVLLAYASFIMVYNFLYSYAIPFQADLLSEADVTGRSIVLLPAAQGVGIAAGPFLSGFIVSRYSYTEAIYFSAALLVLALVVFRLSITTKPG